MGVCCQLVYQNTGRCTVEANGEEIVFHDDRFKKIYSMHKRHGFRVPPNKIGDYNGKAFVYPKKDKELYYKAFVELYMPKYNNDEFELVESKLTKG